MPNESDGQLPPPGWYLDKHGTMRWWDGAAFTEATRSSPVPTAPLAAHPAGRSGTPWYARKVTWLVSAAVVVLALAVGSVGGDEEPKDEAARAGSVAAEESPDQAEAEPVVEPEEAEPLDTDGDGVADASDPRPRNANIRTEDDVDTDADGVPDYQDDFPRDPEFSSDEDDDGVADRLDAFPTDARYSEDRDEDGVADTVDAFPGDPTKSKITLAMENALVSAENYLSFSGFSRQGLIDQLSSSYGDGYNVDDAAWAVSQLDVDWRKQAVRSARNYLSFTGFSRQGLIDQLSSSYGDKYTVEEATYAVDKVGL